MNLYLGGYMLVEYNDIINTDVDTLCKNLSIQLNLPYEEPQYIVDELPIEDTLDTTVGTERFIPMRFYKDFNIFRLSELTSKIITLDENFQLPNNSVLHVLDNFARDPIDPMKPIATKTTYTSCDTPDMENNVFISQEEYRKYIYHVTDFDKEGPFEINDKYMFLKINQQKNFMKFRSTYQARCRALPGIESIPKPPTTFTIVNHNTLFRVIVRGILSTYRRFNLIFSSIFNTVCKSPMDKLQFIHIPLKYEVYDQTMFLKTRHVLNVNTLRFQHRMQYMLFVHLYNFLNPDATASMFNNFPKELYDKLTFIFQAGKYIIIFTLADITTLCSTPTAYRKFIALMNNLMESANRDMISTIHTDEITRPTISLLKEADEDTEEGIQEQEEPSLGETVLDEVVELSERTVHSADTKEDTKNIAKNIIQNVKQAVKETTVTKKQEQTINDYAATVKSVDKLFDSLDEDLEDPIELQLPVTKESTESTDTSSDATEVGSIEELHEVFTASSTLPQMKSSTSTIRPAIQKKDVGQIGKTYISELDQVSKEIIDNAKQLTPKQKQRLQIIAQKYKTVQLEGVSLEQIMKEDIDASLETTNTSEIVEDYVDDKSMVKNSISKMDKLYIDKFFKRDLANTVTSFAKSGMFLTDVSTEEKVSDISKTKAYTCKFEDISGKKHTVKFELPIIDKRGRCLVDGTEYYFKKQIVALPICKLSETKVSLASNYNKTVVERNTTKAHSFLEYIQRIIDGINSAYPQPVIQMTFGSYEYRQQELPYEYTRLGSRYDALALSVNLDQLKDTILFNFRYEERFKDIDNSDKLLELESKFGVYIGRRKKDTNALIFIDMNNILHLLTVDSNYTVQGHRKTCFIDLLLDLYPAYKSSTNIPSLTEWADLKILDKKIPIGFILSYRFGLRSMLDFLNVRYVLAPKRGGINRRITKTDITIPFADKNLIIPRYPLQNSLIVAGLRFFDTNQVMFEDMDLPDAYYTLVNLKGISTNYFKGIDSTFELFIDPITREVLLQMGEPTTFKELLIRAVEMVSTDFHKDATSATNHRIRSYERLNTILYNEMSKHFATYMNRTGAGNTFSLEPKTVLRRIMQDQAMMTVEDINPIHDIKSQTSLTFSGFGGRTSESFVASDRKFSDDALGVISELTVDSGAVGIVVNSTMDPKLSGVRGFVVKDGTEKLGPTNMLSVSSLLMPGATQDDSKRCGFVGIQLSHHVPVKESEVGRIRTGYERIIAHTASDKYAYAAERNGKVVSMDDKLKLIKVQYTDGEEVVLSYGEDYGYCSDMYVTQDIRTELRPGQPFKKGDILIYNAGFFQRDPYSSQVDWKHGTYANVALMEVGGTFEDSSIISREFGQRISMSPVFERLVSFSKGDVIVSCVEEQTSVDVNDRLLILENADISSFTLGSTFSEETEEYLIGLNRVAPKAKHSGKIVKIAAFYGCEIKDMHPSIAKIVRKINTVREQKHAFSAGASNSMNYTKPVPLPVDSKYRGIDFTEDTVVFQFLIQENLSAGVGDKQVIDSSLKTIIADVMDEPAVTESGEKIDIIFSASSISNRIVCSPFTGIGERVMRKLESDVIEEYFS
jgi:hypothetical protein